MDAGQLDRRITLQRKVEADDGYTTETESWSALATVSAKLIPISGAERVAAGEVSAFRNIRLKIRKDSIWSDLNETDRLLFEGRPYNILSVMPEGRGFFLIDAAARGDS